MQAYTQPQVVLLNGSKHLYDKRLHNASFTDAFRPRSLIPNPIEPLDPYGNPQPLERRAAARMGGIAREQIGRETAAGGVLRRPPEEASYSSTFGIRIP